MTAWFGSMQQLLVWCETSFGPVMYNRHTGCIADLPLSQPPKTLNDSGRRRFIGSHVALFSTR